MENKVAVITGGASGIGLAYAEILLKHSIKKVFILDIDEKAAQREAEELNRKYGNDRVGYFQVDVTNLKQFDGVVKEILKQNFQIDFFINNAGVTDPDLSISVNLIGTLNGINLAMKYMGKDQGAHGGIVVTTASVAGLYGVSAMPSYAASKWGVIGLVKSLGKPRVYYQTNIKLMAICPGGTITPLVNRVPEELMGPALNEIKEDGYEVNFQSTEFVAKALIKAINENINGSVWVAENCEEAYRVEFPKYTMSKI